jgi:GNAT superfamily N-acetyltransferase
MYEYYGYIALGTLFFILAVYIYIRLSYGFWYYQPVFHVYDFYYYLFPCGIINQELPQKNRYTNITNVKTTYFNKVKSSTKLTDFINFIQVHFLRNGNNIFLPQKQNVVPYFHGHNNPSFFTFYYDKQLIQDTKTNELIPHNKIVGVITARPLHIMILNGGKNATFYAYYVDYLCIDKANRKKGIAQQIIQTHYYNQRHMHKKIHVDLFKREGDLTGIVPLCVYTTYGFFKGNWIKPETLPPRYSIVECNKQNIRFLLDFIKANMKQYFDISVTPELSNVLELIKTGNYYIYFLMDSESPDVANNIQMAYVFKKTCVTIDGHDCISCIASVCSADKSAEDKSRFIQGFMLALDSMKPKYDYLLIEEISHNKKLIDNIKLSVAPSLSSPTAYFFYNFAYNVFRPERVLILGT